MNRDRASRAFLALYDLVGRLRGPGGCPWDAQQTDATVRMYLLEETYEVLDAVERGCPEEVCDELGDLLFQVLFLVRLAGEREEFDLVSVLERITAKMVRRHPHVFGQTRVSGPEEVAENWAKIKEREQELQGRTPGVLERIPENLPALLRAHRLSERASRTAPEGPDRRDLWDRVGRELVRLREASLDGNRERGEEVLGDLLFHLTDLSRRMGFNAEDVLRAANRRFARGHGQPQTY
ncbi:MAG: nucleoside triphosphate pyrophosphohydrolase [Deltaproteobacteria bacterium]|nr:nucleoside triphosphate pyrophosphohydrolase [Deltaproteobacteria bacterium]